MQMEPPRAGEEYYSTLHVHGADFYGNASNKSCSFHEDTSVVPLHLKVILIAPNKNSTFNYTGIY